MQTYIWSNLSPQARTIALARPAALNDPEQHQSVRDIMADVQARGDTAILTYTQQYDHTEATQLRIEKTKLETAWQKLPKADKQALTISKANIETFHTAQKPQTIEIETMAGVTCRRETRPLERVGLYIPGGTAPLVSTLLMLAVPAKIAGVAQRYIVTPPDQKGNIHPVILAAAHLCEISSIYACGGAQAIAGLTYGTETLPACDKIFGPGNAYVAMAKSLAGQIPGGPAIDLPAGPSEAMVIADKYANPAFVAADLLSQAEHDPLAQVICVCTEAEQIRKIQHHIHQHLITLPRRDIAQAALIHGRFFIAPERAAIVEIINRYAPEHLLIQTQAPHKLVPDIRHAGSIFLGPWTPETVGDYATGSNHTLPTNGAARAYSGITLESFMKYITIQTLTYEGLHTLAPTVMRMARMETLEAHRRAVSLRLENNNNSKDITNE